MFPLIPIDVKINIATRMSGLVYLQASVKFSGKGNLSFATFTTLSVDFREEILLTLLRMYMNMLEMEEDFMNYVT